MNEAATSVRGTIIQTPGDNRPGLIVADGGRQIPFQIGGVWQSAIAPAGNQTVDVTLDAEGVVTRVVVVDAQTLAKEKFVTAQDIVRKKFGGQQGSGTDGKSDVLTDFWRTYDKRLGRYALICCGALLVAWFGLPAISATRSLAGPGGSLSVYELMDVIQKVRTGKQSAGFIGTLNWIAVLLPFAVPLVRTRWANLFFCMPLAMLVIAMFNVRSLLGLSNNAGVQHGTQLAIGLIDPAADWGMTVVPILCLLVAGVGVKRYLAYNPRAE